MPSGYPKNGVNKGWFTSERMRGNKFRVGKIPYNKGVKVPNDRRKKISDSVKRYFLEHPEVKQGLSEKRRKTALDNNFGKWMVGKKHSLETRKKMSKDRQGENSPCWIKDRTKLKKQDRRNDSAYKEWRRQVWLRDNFKCKIANPDCKGRLEAHHILAYAKYPELRYDINNGITLCHFHHPRKREDENKLSPYFKQLVAENEVF